MSALSLTLALPPAETGRPQVSAHWCRTRDGDPLAVELFRRHYSCKDPAKKLRGGNYARIGGQGGSLVLISTDGRALFVWRKDSTASTGKPASAVPSSGMRVRSSDLIREASALAWSRWPGERLFTFVDAAKTERRRSRHHAPGWCFRMAGWVDTGERTKEHGLVILAREGRL